MNNIYNEVGMTLELIQKWEHEFKLFTEYCKIDKSDDKRSLSNMNNYLTRNNYISDNEHILIKRIIELRNYVIHKLFIENNYEIANKNILEIKVNIDKTLEIFRSKK